MFPQDLSVSAAENAEGVILPNEKFRFTELSHFRAFNIINDSQNKFVNLSTQQLFVFLKLAAGF